MCTEFAALRRGHNILAEGHCPAHVWHAGESRGVADVAPSFFQVK
jgi:hypothetical protein